MKPNEVVNSYFRGEFCLYHPGVSKHIGEAVELPGYSILFYCTETSEIDLCRFPVSFSKWYTAFIYFSFLRVLKYSFGIVEEP